MTENASPEPGKFPDVAYYLVVDEVTGRYLATVHNEGVWLNVYYERPTVYGRRWTSEVRRETIVAIAFDKSGKQLESLYDRKGIALVDRSGVKTYVTLDELRVYDTGLY